MKSSGIIYYHNWHAQPSVLSAPAKSGKTQTQLGVKLLGMGLVALALGGLTGPFTPRILLEAKYAYLQTRTFIVGTLASNTNSRQENLVKPAIPAGHQLINPLQTPDGASIDPVNKDFSLVIPKIGVNAEVIPSVNPTKPGEYLPALEKGIAHSSLSYFPDEDGAVYLFSHSTNYDWFVSDLNAVFYLLKNLVEEDVIVLFYKGSSYTYKITGKQVVKPSAVSYMAPQAGSKRLILQTCWPPGSTSERLLIFADLIKEQNEAI